MLHQQFLGPDDLSYAADLLRRGGIVAIPTDTVYGLAAYPQHDMAVERLFVAKQRPPEKAIPILVSDVAALQGGGYAPSEAAQRLALTFWPGALTIVVRRSLPKEGELPTVALRLPNHDLARSLIRLAGGALAVTSANLSGGANCTTAREVEAQLGGRIDAILDGGTCPGGVESTVVDASSDEVRMLRQGSIGLDALRAVVNVAR